MNYGDFSNPKGGYNTNNTFLGGYNKKYFPNLESVDDLGKLSVEEKRNFYQRLSFSTLAKDSESLAGKALSYWLTKPTTGLIVENSRVKDLKSVNDYLFNEVRQVILSQKEAFLGGKRDGIRGVRDRLLGLHGHSKWDRISRITIEYKGISFDLVTLAEFKVIQKKMFDNKKLSKEEEIKSDVFSSFHTSGMYSLVVLSVKEVKSDKIFEIKFDSWKSKIEDDYNWDIPTFEQVFFNITNKKLTLPNPDFNNPYHVSSPVAPNKKFITINHSNAKDVENAGYAKPFKFDTKEWDVTEPKIIADFILKL